MTVYLVGAGPGDPGLFTLRGATLLAQADVVMYDRLAGRSLLELVPASAERVYVGKDPAGRSTSQERINELLVEHGRRHRCVVRLKGGDPFVFARGSEELDALRRAGVEVEVVSGVSSALAVPAAAGIPVTERYSSTSFTVVTGHEDATKATNEVDWEAIARVGGTIVILMGVASIRSISRALIEGGLAPSTPVAAVRWGTRPEQSVIRADLATIADQPLRAPSVIVVGDVARAREYAGGHGSLAGARVIVTRAADDPSRLTSMLMGAGAEVIRVPTIDTVGPSDDGVARDRLFAEIDTYEWVILTSPRGARAFLDAVGDLRRLAANRIAVIGPGTAEVLSDNRLIPDLIPHRYVAEGLLEQFPAPVESGRVLIARAEESRGVIEPALEARGWSVDVAPLYRTVPAAVSPERTAEIASADLIVFASSSSVRNFAEAVPRGGWPSTALAIGPVTAATAQELGFDSVVVAEVHTVEGVVRAAETWWAERPR